MAQMSMWLFKLNNKRTEKPKINTKLLKSKLMDTR